MSKETNKKTGLLKIEKENLDNVNSGFDVRFLDEGYVLIRGVNENNNEYEEILYHDLLSALQYAYNNFVIEGNEPLPAISNLPYASAATAVD